MRTRARVPACAPPTVSRDVCRRARPGAARSRGGPVRTGTSWRAGRAARGSLCSRRLALRESSAARTRLRWAVAVRYLACVSLLSEASHIAAVRYLACVLLLSENIYIIIYLILYYIYYIAAVRYLACVLLLSETNEFLRLIINSCKVDLASQNEEIQV